MPYRNGVQRATYEKKVAWLSSDWGLQVATEKFGADLIAQMPVYTRGPRKGKPKGALTWVKCTEGGWMRMKGAPSRAGGVIRPGSYDWALTLSPYNDHDHGRVAEWTWVAAGKDPVVRVLQTPANAEQMVKTYGDNPRYG